MEKITLKPQIKELLFRNQGAGSFSDVLSCNGTTTQEKNLGSILIISHIKYTDEDLSYVIGLVSSLAKREYYSEQSLSEQDPKAAFNRTLRKLNEVLGEFFENKKFRINIGLASIVGDNLYISRLGKFKVSLARNGELIDILNNIELFNKDSDGEEQFSNIISGKLYPGDKLLAYYPLRSVVSREKLLNKLFAESSQEEFEEKIAQLAVNAKNFSCCSAHVEIQEIKEIPIQSIPPRTELTSSGLTATNQINQSSSNPINEKDVEEENEEDNEADKAQTQSKIQDIAASKKNNGKSDPKNQTTVSNQHIISAELSVGKRAHALSSLAGNISKLRNLGKLNSRFRAKTFFFFAAVIIIPLGIFASFKTFYSPNNSKKAINFSKESLRLAQSHLGQNQIQEARTLLYQTLASISTLEDNKNAESILSEIDEILSSIDKTNDKKPEKIAELYAEADSHPLKASHIAPFAEGVMVAADNSIYAVGANGATEISKIALPVKNLFATSDFLNAYDGSGQIWSFDIKKAKAELYSLKNPPQTVDAVIYEDNLYALGTESIYKYGDAATGGTSGNIWASSVNNGISIAVDGNVYILTSTGNLEIYFKGAKTSQFDLQISPAQGSRIHTFKDHAFIYLADKTNARVYIFDKATGSLKSSYDLRSVGAITDISVSPEGTIWVLSSDQKIWVIR